ncbi:MAG: hypothetical protein AAF221_15770 [Pseudomonadota bacterium]
MHFKTLSDWMRAPGGGTIDTELLGLKQEIDALQLKFVALRRERQFNDLMRQLEAAERSGKTHKRWISERRSTSRRSHARAHNQVVPIRGYFQVGNERLFLPGDPNASWSETANCGCTVVFERQIEPRVTLTSQVNEYINIKLSGVSDTGLERFHIEC